MARSRRSAGSVPYERHRTCRATRARPNGWQRRPSGRSTKAFRLRRSPTPRRDSTHPCVNSLSVNAIRRPLLVPVQQHVATVPPSAGRRRCPPHRGACRASRSPAAGPGRPDGSGSHAQYARVRSTGAVVSPGASARTSRVSSVIRRRRRRPWSPSQHGHRLQRRRASTLFGEAIARIVAPQHVFTLPVQPGGTGR